MNEATTNRIIEPRTLRGFNDVLPDDAVVRAALLRRIEDTFSSHGFSPIVTPALEYLEVLKSKGGEESDKNMFEFVDKGGREVAMRFDLTVPLARYVAEHEGVLRFPFRATQIGYVWRGDRPQRGRYRELIQCDADVIGATGPVVDAEILQVIHAALDRLDIGEFEMRVSDRRLLDALFVGLGVDGGSAPLLRAIDKLEKIGVAGVEQELRALGLDAAATSAIFDFVGARDGATLDLAGVERLVAPHGQGAEALAGLADVFALLEAGGVPARRIVFDPSVARGLDYYTGLVYETRLDAAPDVGSISSGGRYDNLAGSFTKTHLPGVGGSIGISRILGALAGGQLSTSLVEVAPLVVVLSPDDPALRPVAARTAAELRASLPARVELYPGEHSHKRQMKYANARGARFAITVDADDVLALKDMTAGSPTETHAPADLGPAIARALERGTSVSD